MENFIVQNISDLKNAVASGKSIDLSKFQSGTWVDYVLELESIVKDADFCGYKNGRTIILSEVQNLDLEIRNGKIVGTGMFVGANGFTNFDFLNRFNHLETLYIGDFEKNKTNILNLNSIANIQSLKKLRLTYFCLENFESISNNLNLEHIDIMHSNIGSVVPLQNLLNLTTLGLFNNKVNDLSPIRHLIEKGIPVIDNNHPIEEWGQGRLAIAIAHNPLENPPMEIVLMGNWAILDYFDGRRAFPGEKRTVVIDDVLVTFEIPYEVLTSSREEIDWFIVQYSRLFRNKKYLGTASEMINISF